MKFRILVLAVALLLSACAALVEVKPVDKTLAIQHVCIQENPKVIVSDFLQLLRDGFDRNGISTEVYKDTKPANCEYIVTYVANQKWEAVYGVFLRDAQIRIEKDGRYVASAHYHAGEGFVATKGQSTKITIDPVIDRMLNKRQEKLEIPRPTYCAEC